MPFSGETVNQQMRLRAQVELQGVALVPLGFYHDEFAARRLLDAVSAHAGILGAVVGTGVFGSAPEDTARGARGTTVLLER
jgi:hypothetical protein